MRDEVDKAMQDKTVRTAESRQATGIQNRCQRDGKIWVRGMGKHCQSAIQLGVNLPPELSKVSSPATVPGMLEQIGKTLSLLAQHAQSQSVEDQRRRGHYCEQEGPHRSGHPNQVH